MKKETFYVMGKKQMGGTWEQLNEVGFKTRSEAAWFGKTKQGDYRWTKLVPHS